jgi:very-short-patch-repair endonuclease
MTREERILWQSLRGNRLKGFHFRRQKIIDGFIVDFYCHKADLVVEVDGPIHETQAEYDTQRDRILSKRGLRILRVENESVRKDLSGVLAHIVTNLTILTQFIRQRYSGFLPLPSQGRGPGG